MSTTILKNPITNNFFIVPNYPFKDKNLKLADRGLLATLCGLPDGWKLTTSGLASILSECEDTIQKSLNRLIKAGYIHREQRRLENGRMGSIIYELIPSPTVGNTASSPRPEKPVTVKPVTDNSTMVNPATEKSLQYNNHIRSDDEETHARKNEDPISEELEEIINLIIKQIETPCLDDKSRSPKSMIANKIRLKLQTGCKISDLRHYIATCIYNSRQENASYKPQLKTHRPAKEAKRQDKFNNFTERDDFDWDAYELKLLTKDRYPSTIKETN